MKRFLTICALVVAMSGVLKAQVTWNQIKSKPFYTQASPPASCTVGSYWFDTDAVAGQNLYGCTATNTWTLMSGSSSIDWSDITNKPLTFTPSTHTHGGGDVTSAVASATALASNPSDCTAGQYATTIDASGNLTCSQVGWSQLGSVPSTFAPSAHAASHGNGGGDAITLAQSQVTNLVTDLAAKITSPDTTSGALKYLRRNTLNDNWELATAGSAYTFAAPLTEALGVVECEVCVTTGESYVKPSWLTQVDYTIVDGLATSATTDTTNASNITSGTLAGNRMGSVPNIQGNAVNAGTPAGQGQLYAWDTTDSRFELASFDSTLMVSGNSIGVATEIIPQYTYGTSVPGSCSQYGLIFFKTDNGTGQKAYYCNGSTYEQIQSGTQGGGSSVGSWSGTVNFGSINDGACADQTFTATGVTAGAILTPGWPSGLESGLFGSMMASAADTVKVRLCNMSGAAVDPASATFAAQLAQGYLNASGAINFGSIADGACTTNTLTVTGAATGDKVSPSWPSGLESGLFGIMSVTAADTVTVRLCNLSGSSVDPASATFGAAVLK